jgi:hypothetical protein
VVRFTHGSSVGRRGVEDGDDRNSDEGSGDADENQADDASDPPVPDTT